MARTFSLVAGVLDMALSRLRALQLQGAEPLGVGLLAEGGARALEGRQHAGGIELAALVVGADGLGGLDALLGGLRLALQLGQVAVDGGELALDLGDARLDGGRAASARPWCAPA